MNQIYNTPDYYHIFVLYITLNLFFTNNVIYLPKYIV